MGILKDRVVKCIFETFNALPAKSKPRVALDGIQEWVPLSGIVLVKGGDMTCVSIGTGMRCLSTLKPELFAAGHVLHDWHAEIMSIRALNHFLLQEANHLLSSPASTSTILRRREEHEMTKAFGQQCLGLREDLRLMMYSSEAPCGDASMELVMEAQEDATPWPVAIPDRETSSQLLGRGSFSQLGIVRRKPARADSPPTLSKSCSDKLALKQCTSILSSVTSLVISPANAYIDTLILPQSQYRAESCERSFGTEGRMKLMAGKVWSGGYAFRPFEIKTTELDFKHSRRSVLVEPRSEMKGSNITAVWTPRIQETLINGVLQGRKQTDLRGASALSKIRTWDLILETYSMLGTLTRNKIMEISTYRDLKRSSALEDRLQVKRNAKEEALRGWGEDLGHTFNGSYGTPDLEPSVFA